MEVSGDVRFFASSDGFAAWLEVHHATRDELWVGYWKKATGRASMTWEESVDVALCFGWIDGLRKGLDAASYTIRFTPRRPDSVWSKRNMERYRVMDSEGRLQPAGEAAYARRIESRSGLYSFEQDEPLDLPDAYVTRLRSSAAAWRDWQSRPPGYRRQVIHWIMSAKRESTRERRLDALVEDSAAGRKVKPLR